MGPLYVRPFKPVTTAGDVQWRDNDLDQAGGSLPSPSRGGARRPPRS
jgi:hypothetical protein